MRSRTIVAALAAPLMAAGTLALTAGSASASTWQDTSIQVTHIYTEDTYPAAPATAATSLGKITVTRAAAGGLLSVNSQASSLPGSVTAAVSGTIITLSGSIVSPPGSQPRDSPAGLRVRRRRTRWIRPIGRIRRTRRLVVIQRRLEPLRGHPDVVRGELSRPLGVTQTNRGQDRAVLGQRVVHAAAQRQRAVLEPADLALEPVVHLLQLRVAAQLAQQLVERDVGGEELPHGALGAVRGHPVDELLKARQVRLRNPRDQQPDRHHLERLADLVCVDQLLRGQRPDLGPAPRPHRDQPFGRQAAHGFPDGAAAYRELLGQRDLG